MVWSHNDSWMVTGDHGGYVKYWQSNMNNVKMYQAHKEAIRGIRYCQMFVIVICIYPAASMRPSPNHPEFLSLSLSLDLIVQLVLVYPGLISFALILYLHYLSPAGAVAIFVYSIKTSTGCNKPGLSRFPLNSCSISHRHIPHKVP